MMRSIAFFACGLVAGALLLAGPVISQEKEEDPHAKYGRDVPGPEDYAEIMKKWQATTIPGKYHERLKYFVGEWESKGEVDIAGLHHTLSGSGTLTYAWDCDRWCLIERDAFDMDELGKMGGVGLWSYDTKRKKYRLSWVDSMGGTARGTAKYDDSSSTWNIKAKSRSPFGTITGRGTLTAVDNDTVEWTWKERAFLGLIKVSESKGSMHRK